MIDRNQTLHGVLLDAGNRATLDAVRELVEAGELRPIVSSVHPLEDVAQAHTELARGHVQGKIVLRVR